MSFTGWMALTGGVLLILALSSALLRRLPLSVSIIYLGVGILAGPLGFDWLHLNFIFEAHWVERLTEVAVIVSLFMGGLKLRLPLRNGIWRPAFYMAGPVMIVCIAAVAAVAHLVLHIELALALLLGAMLAPTDPVLAGAVSVNDSSDHDHVRFTLSAEAGLNDGTAFPFVMFALLWAEHSGGGAWIGAWFLHRILWAVPAGLAFGYMLGRCVGVLAIWLRSRHRDTNAPTDFLALALIALAYVGADTMGAWGFLAVFAAGVGLRHAEVRAERKESKTHASETNPEGHPPPAEHAVGATVSPEALSDPAVAAGMIVGETLSFGETAERLMEIFVVFIVGLALSSNWNARALVLAGALLFVIRPVATWLLLGRSICNGRQKLLVSWFGIRGIGSLYYLAYAQTHGLTRESAALPVSLTVSVIALSVLLHGVTVQPLLRWYEAKARG